MDNKIFSRIAVWALVGLVLFTVFRQYEDAYAPPRDTISYTQFMEDAKAGKVRRVDIQGRTLIVTPQTGEEFKLTNPGDIWMVDELRKSNVQIYGKAEEEPSLLTTIFISWFPMILLIGVWIFFMRRMQGGAGGGGGAFSFGKSKARKLDEESNKVRFRDVAGCNEAKEDVQEIVDFLREPKRFQRLGGRIPRGLLLVGPPGTGKTLLAKAIAGEAGVPFFTISGSDFVEMFVGVGAARVRDMFETAKKNEPCIIFIDEIDAVGRQRGAGLGGGNDEREQTLNQMLVEMDGFDSGANVIVIAATNRPDVLDPALLRPGRFDRQVVVPLPDIRGRDQILNVHMRKIPVGKDVDSMVIARGTPGFSGADLANLPRVRPCRRGTPDAQVRSSPQGHDRSARSCARSDDAASEGRPLRLRSPVPAHAHRDSLRRPHRRGGLHEPDDDRRFERLRARHADGPRHGDALRHERQARAHGLL